jgi:acyl dehydratase
MPIDVAAALASPPLCKPASWESNDVILYHMGIGAGLGHPTDPGELRYAFERDLKVLPSFGVIPVMETLLAVNTFEGMDIDFEQVLHGEQELVIHRPLPTSASVENRARIREIHDKGKAAVVVLEVETVDEAGQLLCTNRSTIFARGEGGFGGDGQGSAAAEGRPQRAPDARVEAPTLPGQALLYRLSGDTNPMHADPELARAAGFDRPILQGLCTFGIACKAVVDEMLDGDVTALGSFRARFAQPVLPGETIVVALWREEDRIFVEASTAERGEAVLTNAVATIRSPS